ncbi:MAG TPA: hypothetical protein VEQ34_10380 [Pyrinomonadaceae bacterium]|nr:hypothetical protein [Pyrinomonadaceae bacterium]
MKKFYLTGACFSALLLAAACNQAPNTTVTTNTTANTATANTANTNSGAMNANSSTASTATIEAREPEQYQATVTLKLDTTGAQGQNTMNLPPLTAQVARNGADKRMEFSMPGGEKVIYLDRADKRLLIMPNRKQYAEINRESVGVEVRDIMTPGQLVERARGLRGVEQVGEEQFNGRTAVRYRYGAVTDTKSQAGQVQTESFVLVDKETGLPVRSETVSEAGTTANVQGNQVKGLRLLTEMNNIHTTAPADLFAEPTDYAKIPPEQVRNQVMGIFQAAGLILGQLIKSAPATVSSPGATPPTLNTPANTAPQQ